MSRFEDKRINDYFSDADSFKAISERSDPNDKMVRAFLINKDALDAIKQKPNAQIKLKNGKTIVLEIGTYLTSNGKILSEDVFNNHYKPASLFVKSFLKSRIQLSENIPEIIEKIHNKSKKNNVQRPKA